MDKNLNDYKDLLMESKAVTVLAIERGKKSPHLTPVWFLLDEKNFANKEITINTSQTRTKGKLLKVGTKVSLNIIDPSNVLRYLTIGGEVTSAVKGEEGVRHINKESQKYIGKDYPWLQPGEIRVKYVIKMNKLY